jgi:predicted TIM-barrel fold metal-dependent hydrolase
MRDGYRIVDADGHVSEPHEIWRDYLDARFRDHISYGEDGWVRVDGERVNRIAGFRPQQPRTDHNRLGAAIARDFDAVSLLQAMDREGIDVSVNFASRGLFVPFAEAPPAEVSAALARAFNNWLAEYCAEDPARLLGAAAISLKDPAEAVREARRAVETLGYRALFIRPNPTRGRNLGDPAYDEFYAAVADLDVALCVHEGLGAAAPQVGADRYTTYLQRHAICHPVEQMMAVMDLIVTGVLDRHPRLRVAFLESGASWLPYWLWRLDEHVELAGAAEAPALTMAPSAYFRRQCFISTEADEGPVRSVVEHVGAEVLIWASDYPHPDGKFPHAVETFLAHPALTGEVKHRVLWDNPARLYKLGTS